MVCEYAEVDYELIDEMKAIYENIQSSDYFNALTELSKNYIEARIHLLAHTLSEDYLDDLKVEDSLKNRLKKHFHRSAFILNSKLYTIPSCLFSFPSQKTLSFQIRAPFFVHQSISHHRTSLLAQHSVIFCITLIQ